MKRVIRIFGLQAIFSGKDWSKAILSCFLPLYRHKLVFYIGLVLLMASPAFGQPNPPTNLSAYSDYTTPTIIGLLWVDPSTDINGNPLNVFTIEIYRDNVHIATLPSGTQNYADVGLTDGQEYHYQVYAKDGNDTTGVAAYASWFAGGHPMPASPDSLACEVDSGKVTLTWRDPVTQKDGTPLDDLDFISIYRNHLLISIAGPGGESFIDMPPAGESYIYTVMAVDNEAPQNESDSITVICDATPDTSDSSYSCMVIDPLNVVSAGGDMSGWQWELEFIVGNFNPYNSIADELVIYPDPQTGLNSKGLGHPDTLTFNPPLSSGSYSGLQNIAFYSATHQPGDTLCLVMQLHSENAACCPPDTVCVVLPPGGGNSQPCFFVQDVSLTCDTSGIYHYTFSVTNWSAFSNPGSDGVNVHIESALPAGVTVSPMDVAVSPPLGYGETSGPLTISISGAPAQPDSVICLAMQLHGPWNDAIQNYEWCCPLDTLYLTLPECNTPVGEPDTTCIAAPDSMLDWWPMDEPVPGTVNDCARFNNVGTVFGSPVVFPGKVGNALDFDTEDDWVEVPDHPEINFDVNNFSIEAWICGNPGPQDFHVMLAKYDGSDNGYVLYLQNQDIGFNIGHSTFTAGPYIRDGEWHHLAVTVDRFSNDVRFYFDGALFHHFPNATSLPLASNNQPLYIGNFPLQPNLFFKGQIDELTFYNRALSAQEIAAIWQADSLGKCKPDTLAPPESRTGNLQTPMLKQNYPNPFNPSTTIAFQLPEKAEVSVKVYDILGQEVAILAKREFFAAGDHQLNFYADKLGSGIYFYRITAIINGKQHREMRKMLLVK